MSQIDRNTEKTILQTFFDYRIEDALQEYAQKNEQYMKQLEDMDKISETIDHLGLSPEQAAAFDEAISIANAMGGIYGDVAYRLGFKDGFRMRGEVHEIKSMDINTLAE